MAAAKSPRKTRKEVLAPDEFMNWMVKALDFMRLYGGWVAAGAVLILLGVVAGVYLSRFQESSTIDKARAFDRAAAGALSVDDPAFQPANEDDDAQAEAEATRKSAATSLAALDAFIKEHEGRPLGETALLAKTAAALRAGEPAQAHEACRAWLDRNADSTLAPIVLEACGEAADRAGMRDAAIAAFTAMTTSGPALMKAYGSLHLGDLFHPGLATAGEAGDATQAGTWSEKGLAEIPGDENELPPAHLIARKTLMARLNGLP
jgi:hypothetical protein